jgi:hypothetical protein
MKNLLLLIFLWGITAFASAQGDLQFNQVLSYSQTYTATSTNNGPWTFTSQLYIVPIGKVWKVEKFLMDASGTTAPGWLIVNSGYKLKPNDVNSGPVWLKAGDEIAAEYITSGGSQPRGAYFISIIEFNITP